jgi:ribose 5-phosphate isomerase A
VVRTGTLSKAGPLKTDQDNFIVDAPFQPLMIPKDIQKANSLHETHQGPSGQGEGGKWEVERLTREIKMIEGVLSVGIFSGEDGVEAQARGAKLGGQKPVAAYFGMTDGGVVLRTKGKEEKLS